MPSEDLLLRGIPQEAGRQPVSNGSNGTSKCKIIKSMPGCTLQNNLTNIIVWFLSIFKFLQLLIIGKLVTLKKW